MYDIYVEIAAAMSWLDRTVLKMGGMQGCELAFENTSPTGQLCDQVVEVIITPFNIQDFQLKLLQLVRTPSSS